MEYVGTGQQPVAFTSTTGLEAYAVVQEVSAA